MVKAWLGKPVSKDGTDCIELPALIAANGPMTIRLAGDMTVFGTVTLAPDANYAKDVNDDPLAVNMFGSWHEGVTHFASADGAVRAVKNTTDPTTLRLFIQRDDRQTVDFGK